MISEKMQKAINDQINAEIYSSYLYLSMSAAFESLDLEGGGNWFRCQAQEELVHAMKFFHYLTERQARVILAPLAGPPTEWASPLAIFEEAYKHEQKVTGLIHHLVDLAITEKDHTTNNILQWLISEQIEEEKSTGTLATKLKLIGKDTTALFMLDQEMAARTFVMPASMSTLGAPTAPGA